MSKRLEFTDLVLFEDDNYLVINKPAGLSTLEDRASETDVLSLAKEHFANAQVCHRIDKDTSGALVLAKNPEAYTHLSLQFQHREVGKKYHAVVHGSREFKEQVVDVPLTVKAQGAVRWDTRHGKDSQTVFTTLELYKVCSLIECKPITGRRHQIRVHLKYLENPIIADTSYGGHSIYLSQLKRKYHPGRRPERALIERMALHAHSISFTSPDNKSISIEAPYPKDFEILLKQLRKYSST